jgi:hypothetical protein
MSVMLLLSWHEMNTDIRRSKESPVDWTQFALSLGGDRGVDTHSVGSGTARAGCTSLARNGFRKSGELSLVRIDKETGKETGRLWFTDRSPSMRLDPATGVAVVFEDNAFFAMRFAPVN